MYCLTVFCRYPKLTNIFRHWTSQRNIQDHHHRVSAFVIVVVVVVVVFVVAFIVDGLSYLVIVIRLVTTITISHIPCILTRHIPNEC